MEWRGGGGGGGGGGGEGGRKKEEEEGVTKMLRGPYSHSHGAQRAVIKLPLSNRLTMDPAHETRREDTRKLRTLLPTKKKKRKKEKKIGNSH